MYIQSGVESQPIDVESTQMIFARARDANAESQPKNTESQPSGILFTRKRDSRTQQLSTKSLDFISCNRQAHF